MYKIIFILTFSPKYEYVGSLKPEEIDHHWINPKGEIIGVWKGDFSHIFGFNLIKYYPEISFEVWRPDYRADKIYTHVFENGLIHRSFPEKKVKIKKGLLRKSYVYAPLMENYLQELVYDQKVPTVIMIPAAGTAFSTKLVKKFNSKIPILGFHFTNNNSLLAKVPQTNNILKKLHYYSIHLQQINQLKKFNCISVSHFESIDEIKKLSHCNVRFNQLGADSENWETNMTKEQARKVLNLKAKRILLFSSRLVPEYQIDKVLKVFEKFAGFDFLCVFTSRGPLYYTNQLYEMVKTLKLENNILFTGYLKIEELKKYIIACDVFCTTAIQSAGSGAAISAILLNRPVITTQTGLVSEILNKYNSGILLPPTDYTKWVEVFSSAIKNDKFHINLLDRQIIISLLSWEICLKNWLDTFHETLDNFQTKHSRV